MKCMIYTITFEVPGQPIVVITVGVRDAPGVTHVDVIGTQRAMLWARCISSSESTSNSDCHSHNVAFVNETEQFKSVGIIPAHVESSSRAYLSWQAVQTTVPALGLQSHVKQGSGHSAT